MSRTLYVLALTLLGAGLPEFAPAQCPEAAFLLPAAACREQLIIPDHALVSGNFGWDFCAGDLGGMPTNSGPPLSLSQAVGRPSTDIIKDGSTWYGFFTGTWTNTLYRLTYANGFRDAPTLTENLGNLGGKLNGPGSIRLIREGSLWFGIIHNTGNGELLRLSFGSSLNNVPVVSTLITGVGYGNSGLACARDLTHGWLAMLSNSNNTMTILRLGTSVSPPGPSDIITSPVFPNANNLGDIELVESCGQWYGFALNFGNGTWYRLGFATDLFQTPTVTELAALPPGNPGRLRIAYDAGKYRALITTLAGNLLRVDLGSDLTFITPAIEDLGNYGGSLQNSYGLDWDADNSEWSAWVTNLSTGSVARLDFPNPCDASPAVSLDIQPRIQFMEAGIKFVDLRRTTNGTAYYGSGILSVSASVSPDIVFSWSGACAANNISFLPENSSSDIQAYQWDFGDGSTSSQASPVYSYPSVGSYLTLLEVTSTNGCTNQALATVPVYNAPASDFSWTLPVVACSNQLYPFFNDTVFDPGSSPRWEWSINGLPASDEMEPSLLFPDPGDQLVKLKASIDGCETEIEKPLTGFVEGPAVDFIHPVSGCQQSEVSFVNTTGGQVTGFLWDFGDGSSSTEINPSHPYSAIGTRTVTLTAFNAAGCENFSSRLLPIYSSPQPAFQLALPPFSCSGSPAQFTDLTPNPPDSNLSSWSWNFGDPSTSLDISSGRNPTYTYAVTGSYDVTLAVTSNYGCIGSALQTVLISPAPSAVFTHSPSCLGQPTAFDGPSAGVVQWSWSMESSAYTVADPVHIFSSAGDTMVRLITTGSNGCQSVIEKLLSVPAPPAMDLEALYPCTSQMTEYTDRSTPALNDPFTQWSWRVGDTGPASGNPLAFTHTYPGTFPVELTVTAQSGCTYIHSEVVTISSAPLAYFTASPDEGTNPLPVYFSASMDGVADWTWDFDDGSQVQSGPSLNHTYQSLGEYSANLIVTNALQCTNSMTRMIRVITPQPDARIVDFYLVESTAGFSTPIAVIENNGNTTLSALTFQLIIDGLSQVQEIVPQAIAPGQQLSFAFSLSVPDLTSNQNLCSEVVVAADINPLDNRACLSEDIELELLSVSPSPAADYVLIDWISNGDQAEFYVSDTHGAVVLSQMIPRGNAGLYRLQFDVRYLSSGLYVVHLRSGNRRESVRFMINH